MAKLPVGRRLEVGQEVVLTMPVDKLHLFDRETEEALPVAVGS